MAGLRANKVLCFANSHFGNIPNENIAAVIRKFYSDDLVKAKTVIHGFCN